MRRILSILLPIILCTLLFARSGMLTPPDSEQVEKKIVHLKSDLSGPVSKGDSVIFMVGNFAAQHNGAVITCDSAVRYSDAHIECFGNVLINQNTTYIYGDRADYNRDLNLVVIYSPIVKVVDGDATLYTRHFEFNTKEQVGRFDNGGVLINRENLFEAERGYYYAETKELIGVDRVQMRSEEYDMTGDSVVYNMQTDNAFFFDRTNIWNIDGDYLYGDRGAYSKPESRYMVTRNGYLLTEKQELWSDTLDYFRAEEHAILRSNLQIDDTEHKNLCFGDYGEYWKSPGNAFLTRRPSIINYDKEQGPDSLFMRSDSIYLYTLRLGEPIPNEYGTSAAADEEQSESEEGEERDEEDELTMSADRTGVVANALSDESERPANTASAIARRGDLASNREAVAASDNLPQGEGATLSDNTTNEEGEQTAEPTVAADSMATDSVAADTLSQKERRLLERKQQKEEQKKRAAEMRAKRDSARKVLLDSIAIQRQIKNTAKLKEQERRDSIAAAKALEKRRAKVRAYYERNLKKGKRFETDSTFLPMVDSLFQLDFESFDQLMSHRIDSIDSVRIAHLPKDTLPITDSIYRLVKGLRNVRIYRTDFQAVCDSLTSLTSDSTLHLYIDPVLWNENNQISSEWMDIYTAEQKLHHADFVGEPMMASQFDTIYYDQITGKEMQAFFIENEIRRVDVNGNAQTIFFQKDGYPQEVVFMAVIESGDATFYIADRQLEKIVYRTNPVWPIYPIDGLPEDQSLYLKGFKWQGDRRPTRDDVFDRTIRPSERLHRSALSRPTFPIKKSIDDARKRLNEQGSWADRTETVDAATVEWMHSLGFEVGQPRKQQEQ